MPEETERKQAGSGGAEERTRARKKALVFLTDMDRSEKELLEKLKKSGFSEEVCQDAVGYVKSFGYVDDERYAGHYVKSFETRRSRRRIESDLMRKGIPGELIREAIEEIDDGEQKKLIDELARKKLKTLNKEEPKSRRRLASYLAGKGFSMSEILPVLRKYFEDDGEDPLLE